MAPHSSTLAWKIPWMEEPGRLQSMRSLRVGHDWATSLSLSCIGEGNGNPLQCSCLENPRDGGAWWAAVCGVAQSRIRLQRLSSISSHFSVALGWLWEPGLKDLPSPHFQVHCTWKKLWERKLRDLNSTPSCTVGLLGLANKNTGYPVKFEFQITTCNTILLKNNLFTWNSNFIMCHIF